MRLLKICIVCMFFSQILLAQRSIEKLNRGLVAVRTSASQVYISWRMFGYDPANVSFNIYRNNEKINTAPITQTTDYVDNTTLNATYAVRAIMNNIEQPDSEKTTTLTQPYISVPLAIPVAGKTPAGEVYDYSANDASVGDLDGDGEYEIILKWDPSNSKDNSQSGYTGNVYIDAYKMTGERLWRIDLGRNIRAGAHYTQFMVYDLDGDGRAEVACKTADATIDGKGKIIGNANADYRNTNGYVLSGPEFLTVFDGLTGGALATEQFYPQRDVNAGDNPTPAQMKTGWGDDYGNRIDRFVSAVAYLDGKLPSLVIGRGYYTRMVRVAWDWRNGKLTKRWIFDSIDPTNTAHKKYEHEGNHQLTVGDVDGDGKDEIVNGASAIDDDGKGLYANGLGHGDALHMSDMDPDRPGQEVWQCHETPSYYGAYGLEFRDGKTGKPIFGVDGEAKDVGRCMTADIDPRHKGYEMWGAVGGLYNVKGEKISASRPGSMNFAIWWDADLSRELLDGNHIDKWDYKTNTVVRLVTAAECTSNNTTKATPCLSGDLLGDWREEVMWRTLDNKYLRIYTTTIPANNRLYTLLHDPQYRLALAWQNTAYNQPPHPSFYVGDGMSTPPKPDIAQLGTVVTGINNTANSLEINAFPNPFSSQITIRTANDFDYIATDISGKILQKGHAKNQITMGQNWQSGSYWITITTRTLTKTVAVVKH
jgi:rhamnogalacturonan endolyase